MTRPPSRFISPKSRVMSTQSTMPNLSGSRSFVPRLRSGATLGWLAKKCKVFTYDPSQTGALTKLVADHAQTLIKGAGLSKPAVAAQLHVNLSCYLVVLLLKAFLNPCCGFPCSSKATLSVLNWSAPAVHSQLAQEAQACCFAHTVSDSFCNLAVLLCPVFHYKKHQMQVLEHFLLKSLACRDVDLVDVQGSQRFPGHQTLSVPHSHHPALHQGGPVR